ncbi:MAG: hypothetical protein ABL888_06695 [Pirellulaceae bacterium]
MHLLDINVWRGLAFKRQEHHIPAKAWFQSIAPGRCCFCRLTQMGFLRLASNPQVMGPSVVTLQQAWQAYDAILGEIDFDSNRWNWHFGGYLADYL